MCSWEKFGTITCNRRFGGKKCCMLQEGGHRGQVSNEGLRPDSDYLFSVSYINI